ncbi:hypothetical protein B0H16DRAFT_1469994 [Mycena metata]|uniref:Uncharacterized protein n=1 Tax=Mycena metata TaxID=1033252 RepID=A0AAD7MRM7_9AGAR|nr:hypothetical protein B0H16DRAFT_1476656 [Mycena metata]KAJ7729603.1 hypothetical protein B0H16DRAFT_1469987 [Mycena metata]KAJ7729610.1 hypothetical protein B0H16DRAFT_1469994 [Mycena metata]
MAQVSAALKPATIEEWGKVRRVDSDEGDTMRAWSLGTTAEDSRDATYVRYEMLEDKHMRKRKREPEFELKTYYGQLTHIYRVHFPQKCKAMHIEDETTYILAAIRNYIHFYSRYGGLDVIDITSVQCLIGRVKDLSDDWAIIDRSGSLAHWSSNSLKSPGLRLSVL